MQNYPAVDNVDYDIKDMIDCKVGMLRDVLLSRVVMPWLKIARPTEFDVGFKHGQVHEIMERFYDCYPELFDEGKNRYDVSITRDVPPTIAVTFGKTNIGLKGEYAELVVGGPTLNEQVALLLRNIGENQ